jgi:hypothetical protein
LAFNGLRSYLKVKLKGFEYHIVNYLQMKVLGSEFKLKNAKDTNKTHRSSTHVIDHGSDNSNDESKEVYGQVHLAIKGQTLFLPISQANSKESTR